MGKLSYHRHKKTGVTYVYSIEECYWDKEKKSPRNKQVCLGKLDQLTGAIIPSRRRTKMKKEEEVASDVTATSKVAGPYLLLEKITQKHGIDILLKKCFPDHWQMMLSLVYFIVHKGNALSRSQSWSNACLHPFTNAIASQRISECLQAISEDQRLRFFSFWIKQVLETEYLCYDITSISSYAKNNEYTRFGYNRDNESLEQINLAMLFGQISNLPTYYRRMPGNISDVATLKTTIKSMEFLGTSNMHLILDRGFYSESNIDKLYEYQHKFTVALPIGRKWVEAYLDKHKESITSPTNYLNTRADEAIYAVTELHKWGNNKHRSYLHIYYNAAHAAAEFDRFTRKLIAYRHEVIAGKILEEHKELYSRYLIIKETPKRGLKVTFNDEEIQKHRKRYSGFFCILSNKIKNPEEALRVYRTKDVVENSFDDLKNHLDMKRLRVHTAAAMDSRLFLQFLALIYISSIRNITRENQTLQYLTAREVIEEMESLNRIAFSNRYGKIFTETNPLQRHIIKAFDIQFPQP